MPKKNIKIKELMITVALTLVMLFFIMIAIFQTYESESINGDTERIVLGVNSSMTSEFGSTIKGRPVNIGEYVGIVSGGNFTVIDRNANIKTTANFMLSDPIMHSKGKYCVVSDYKGKTVRLYKEGEIETEVECDGKVISVVTNVNGFFAVATEETGYNAVITVYHKDGDAIYRYRISKNTFVDMDISANNRKLIVVEANVALATPGSNVVLVEFNREGAQSEFFVENNLYVGVHFNKNGSFVCLGNKSADFYRSDCAKAGEVRFEGRSLHHADISTDDVVCFAFDGADGAPVGSSVLEIYDKNAVLRGSIAFENKIEHLSVNNAYIGVAHGEVLDVVKTNGKIKKSFEVSSPIKCAMPFENGVAALIFAGGNTTVVR
ncbi:MAG: hypothetical protein IJC69_08330 [Clostridia bacterium]|nr:hypothetical protein [Clostridia bacterium]